MVHIIYELLEMKCAALLKMLKTTDLRDASAVTPSNRSKATFLTLMVIIWD
jgi:hypothetical protein